MIVQCKSGVQIVIGECPWVPGVYLSVGNQRGCRARTAATDSRERSMGAILTPGELDQVRTELDRIAGELAGRAAAKQQRKVA